MNKVLAKANWQTSDVDLFEINEAFAMVTMLAVEKMSLDINKVNVNGGACALGHPLGASGARIMVTLIHALKSKGLSKGIASLCIGGGEATAIALEIL
jgi:acetyl-CoA C-acetyltransferase